MAPHGKTSVKAVSSGREFAPPASVPLGTSGPEENGSMNFGDMLNYCHVHTLGAPGYPLPR